MTDKPRTMWIGGMLLDLDRLEQMAAPAWTTRVAAALFERIQLTEAIVRDLAASDPTDSYTRRCVLCGELADNDDPLNCHQPWCVKRRAVEAKP